MTEQTYSEPVSQLVALGMPEHPWLDYPAKFGLTSEHIPDLLRMAIDPTTWDEEGDDAAVYRNIHAWRALAQLHAVEAAPALVELFRWVDEHSDDWTGEDLPVAMGMLGPSIIPILAAYAADEQHGFWARVAAITSLVEVGNQNPDTKTMVAAAITPILARYRENSTEFNADLVSALSDLRQPGTYPLVEEAYQAGKVDFSILGDWEDFQVRVGLLKQRITPKPSYNRIPHFFSEPPAQPGKTQKPRQDPDKKAKNKAKQEKLSRKKNRKKK